MKTSQTKEIQIIKVDKMQTLRASSACLLRLFSIKLALIVVISHVLCSAKAQETFIIADHQYESLRNYYGHQQSECILALPQIVAQGSHASTPN
jgi:hypothetical protein